MIEIKREGNDEVLTMTLKRTLQTFSVYSKKNYEDLIKEGKLDFEGQPPVAQEDVKAVVVIHALGEKPKASSVLFVTDNCSMTLNSFIRPYFQGDPS